jgi:hypothetical protein
VRACACVYICVTVRDYPHNSVEVCMADICVCVCVRVCVRESE